MPVEMFKASHGWFSNIKKQTGIHSVVRQWEASSSNVKTLEEYVERFASLVAGECYIAQQVVNCDKTVLFWKKMPRRIFTAAEEKKLLAHKPMKDRLTVALCANASGDGKIKPLLVYHSENPYNAPGHPPGLEDDILDEFKFVRVLYLPPNTTPLLQPMDQQVISNFKKLYTKYLFKKSFDGTNNTNLTLHEVWKDHFNIG
ncbi:tigger transposable element-derived protein 1-like [Palaemon carinicauda]|uniref:tigger transposable element-derived protein 1-like n=1 Tax=Palaemon carinicauda TaxID=392227 RepID=UPI0035B5A454